MVRRSYRGNPNGIRVAVAVLLCVLLSTGMSPLSAFADDSLGAAAVADDSLSSGNPSFVGEPNSDDAGEGFDVANSTDDVSVTLLAPQGTGIQTSKTPDEAISWAHAQLGKKIGSGQCVAFVKAYYEYLGMNTGNVWGNAKDYATNYCFGWERVKGGVPQKGDILVYSVSSNGYGHVAICDATNSIYEQNYNNCGIVQHHNWGYSSGYEPGYWGYIRPNWSTVSHNPVGCLDAATGGDGTVTVWGWAFDPDNPSASIQVHVYVGGTSANGEGHAGIVANQPRSDVNKVYGISGNHGFVATFTTGKRGSVEVHAYGINIGGGSNAELSYIKSATVAAAPSKITSQIAAGTYAIRAKLKPTAGLDVAGVSNANNADIQLYDWLGGKNQQFSISSAGGSAYYITALHSGKAVEVGGSLMNPGANVNQYSRNQANCQKWYFDKNSDGTYGIRNKASDLKMDLPDFKTANGTSIKQHTINGSEAQKFYLVPVDASRWNISVPAQAYTGSSVKPAPVVTAGGVRLQQGKDYTVSYGNNVDVGTGTLTITAKNGYSGKKSAAFRINVNNKAPMYRLYNPYSGEHFYTGNASEKNNLVKLGWRYEGIGWNAPKSGKDVYRLYNPYTGDHHFTPNASEKNACVAAGWRYEGVGWKSNGSVKVYREYNPYAKAFYHNYTRDAKEHAYLCSIGWRSEGTGWNGV